MQLKEKNIQQAHYTSFMMMVMCIPKPAPEKNASKEKNGIRPGGMWISPDPCRQFHGLYSTGGNPINYVDPDGCEEVQYVEGVTPFGPLENPADWWAGSAPNEWQIANFPHDPGIYWDYTAPAAHNLAQSLVDYFAKSYAQSGSAMDLILGVVSQMYLDATPGTNREALTTPAIGSTRALTTSATLVKKSLGLSKIQFGRAIHRIKQQVSNNPDMIFDRHTGDVFDQRSMEWIGNLRD